MNLLTGIYGAATSLRNTLFDRGVLPSRRLEQPVVSVGNLSVGGSGKTPFVIALGELLKARGIQFDVLAREYRRQTRGVRIVYSEGNAADFGDEPLLIAQRLGVPVIVGESRNEAGRVAEQKFQPQLHILDDGFQHRSLARDFDIVLLTERDFDDRMLPSGRLREPLSSLQRADAIVLPRDFSGQNFSVHELTIESLARQGKLIGRMTREISPNTNSSATRSARTVTVSLGKDSTIFRSRSFSLICFVIKMPGHKCWFLGCNSRFSHERGFSTLILRKRSSPKWLLQHQLDARE